MALGPGQDGQLPPFLNAFGVIEVHWEWMGNSILCCLCAHRSSSSQAVTATSYQHQARTGDSSGEGDLRARVQGYLWLSSHLFSLRRCKDKDRIWRKRLQLVPPQLHPDQECPPALPRIGKYNFPLVTLHCHLWAVGGGARTGMIPAVQPSQGFIAGSGFMAPSWQQLILPKLSVIRLGPKAVVEAEPWRFFETCSNNFLSLCSCT